MLDDEMMIIDPEGIHLRDEWDEDSSDSDSDSDEDEYDEEDDDEEEISDL